MSTHVARLERELGATLVDRATGRLTEEGEVAVARARRVQHELEALRADIESMLHQVSGPGAPRLHRHRRPLAGPALLELMAERHPLVHVVVVDATTTSLVPQVVADSLDLAVVNLPVADRELATEPLFDEERIVLARTSHPLAARDGRRWPTWPTTRCCWSRRAPPSATSSTTRWPAAALTVPPPGRDRRHPAAHLAGLRGLRAAVVPATAAPAGTRTDAAGCRSRAWPRRSVGLAALRRGRLSAPARAVRTAIRDLVAGTDHEGVTLTG